MLGSKNNSAQYFEIEKERKCKMMDFYTANIKEIRDKIHIYLESEAFFNFVSKYQSDYFAKEYYELLKRYISGGKCIRGYLVYLGYVLSGGQAQDEILKAAISYEIFEGSILAHDDIVDKSELRRNIPSMYVHLGNNEEGIAKTIFAADAGYFLSNAMLLEMDIDAALLLKAAKYQQKVYSITVSGELKDIGLSYQSEYTKDDVLEMYELKTAAYTTTGPLVLGAILAGADEKLLEALNAIGTYMGVAFQIADDILGIFGDSDAIGKSVTTDAAEGKKTILTAHFNANSTEEERVKFYQVYGNHNLNVADMDYIKEQLTKSGSYAYAQREAQNYITSTKKAIERLNAGNETKEMLHKLCDYMILRKK